MSLPEVQLTPLEQAVETALSPEASSILRAEANQFCHSFKQQEDCWRHCCQQFLYRSKIPECFSTSVCSNQVNEWLLGPRFWYLQVIVDQLPNLSIENRIALQEMFQMYMRDILLARASLTPGPADNPAILAKMALVFIKCLTEDYPTNWATAWSSILDFWNDIRNSNVQTNRTSTSNRQYIAVTQLLLCIYKTFDEELIAEEIHRSPWNKDRSMAIKDGLREGDIIRIANTWALILQDFKTLLLAPESVSTSQSPSKSCESLLSSSTNTLECATEVEPVETQEATRVSIMSGCLKSIVRFIGWIDIQIIGNDRFMPLIFELLYRKSGCGPAAMETIGAMFRKRMDPGQRIVMAHKLNLIDKFVQYITLSELQDEDPYSPSASTTYVLNVNCREPDNYVCALVDVLNVVGVQMIESLNELRSGYNQAVSETAENTPDLRIVGGVACVGANPFFVEITSPEIWIQMQNEAWRMIQEILSKALLTFSHPHPMVTEPILPFLSCVLKLLKQLLLKNNDTSLKTRLSTPKKGTVYKKRVAPGSELSSAEYHLYVPITIIHEILKSLLQTTLERIQYPFWFNLNDSEIATYQHELFIDFRKDATALFKRLYTVDETVSTCFLLETIQRLQAALTASVTGVHVNQIEAVLHLIYIAGETYRDISKELANDNNLALSQCIQIVFSSRELIQHSHLQIRLLMFNIVNRYMAVLQVTQSAALNKPNYLLDVLQILVNSMVLNDQEYAQHTSSKFAIQHRASTTLLKFVRSNVNAVSKFAPYILQFFHDQGLLQVAFLPSEQWPDSAKLHTQQDQVLLDSSISAPLGSAHFAFDDQNRAFEIAGFLLAQCDIPDKIEYFRLIVNQLELPFQDLCSASQTLGYQEGLHAMAKRDLPAALDWTVRILDAMTYFGKSFTLKCEYEKQWMNCVKCLFLALNYFGLDMRVRNSALALTRRLVVLIGIKFAEHLCQLLPKLLDLTLIAFSSSTLCVENQEQTAATDQSAHANGDEQNFMNALLTPRGAIERIKFLNDASYIKQHQSTIQISPTYNGYHEISQLSALICFIVLTLKDGAEDNFLLAIVQKNTHPSPADSWRGIPLFIRIFRPMVDYWYLLPAGSPELQKEKIEIHKNIFQVINCIAVNCPSAFIKLLEIPKSDGSSSIMSLLLWSVFGVKPLTLIYPGAIICCLQTWNVLLNFVLTSPNIVNDPSIDMEELLFEKLKFSDLLRSASQAAFFLDMEDPQHVKILEEICTIFRVFSGCSQQWSGGGASYSNLSLALIRHPKLSEKLHSIFLQAIPSHVCRSQDATLFLQAVTQSSTSKEAKDILRKWITTQQLSAHPQE